MSIFALFPVFVAFFVVAVSPGPANIAVATIAMSKGRWAALRFGLGLGTGLAFWGLIAATGLGSILERSMVALMILKIAGGCYLIWLAYKSWVSAEKPTEAAPQVTDARRWFVRGLFLNLSNPKAVFAWMAALSMGMGQSEGWGPLLVATLICVLIGYGNYIGHAMAFSVSGFMAVYARLRRWIDRAVAVFFAAAGLGLLRSALSR